MDNATSSGVSFARAHAFLEGLVPEGRRALRRRLRGLERALLIDLLNLVRLGDAHFPGLSNNASLKLLQRVAYALP